MDADALTLMKTTPSSELYDITIGEVRKTSVVVIHRMERAVFADSAAHAIHAFKMAYGWKDWYTRHGHNQNWDVAAVPSR